ncbi:hypothetical protein QTL97_04025 [Sporosarcina thermotolerans]|uniref:DUF5667 domain-containing protein n=1 Tax=Sporosarcina thermotolerans TaxID=633404 RepID=A0AAW9A8W8_9BACL|nr:hypothetical protein [Sporosarcina thermotolerans]MDW0116091.1 hypothetical protein [Sporosarcina thermotolerans]WHT48061.1 hypothetical protein QNH10_18800 [Sporosarcina thermotolerans]
MDQKRRSSLQKCKFLIGALLLIGIIGSGVSITFANQDIQSLLMNWFDTQRGHVLDEIKEAIDLEHEIQTGRLKEELHSEIQMANERLQAFTMEEKERRTSELRRYADELINGFVNDNLENENSVRDELDSIFQSAVNEMNRVVNEGNIGQTPIEEPESPEEEEPGEEPEPETEPDPEQDPDPDPDSDPNPDPNPETGSDSDPNPVPVDPNTTPEFDERKRDAK